MIKEIKVNYEQGLLEESLDGGNEIVEQTAIYPQVCLNVNNTVTTIDISSLVPFQYEGDTYLVKVRTKDKPSPITFDTIRLAMDSFEREVDRIKKKSIPDINYEGIVFYKETERV